MKKIKEKKLAAVREMRRRQEREEKLRSEKEEIPKLLQQQMGMRRTGAKLIQASVDSPPTQLKIKTLKLTLPKCYPHFQKLVIFPLHCYKIKERKNFEILYQLSSVKSTLVNLTLFIHVHVGADIVSATMHMLQSIFAASLRLDMFVICVQCMC